MCLTNICPAIVFLVVGIECAVEVHSGGWLNGVVQHMKHKFYEHVEKTEQIKINATLIETPQGYTDSNLWDFESVERLVKLIMSSNCSITVRRVLKRMMAPTRRMMMNKKDTYKYFPSLVKNPRTDIMYEDDFKPDTEYSDENYIEGPLELTNNSVVVITNPVEARLPSGTISVELLKNIMLSRAIAARKLPSTTKKHDTHEITDHNGASSSEINDSSSSSDGEGSHTNSDEDTDDHDSSNESSDKENTEGEDTEHKGSDTEGTDNKSSDGEGTANKSSDKEGTDDKGSDAEGTGDEGTDDEGTNEEDITTTTMAPTTTTTTTTAPVIKAKDVKKTESVMNKIGKFFGG